MRLVRCWAVGLAVALAIGSATAGRARGSDLTVLYRAAQPTNLFVSLVRGLSLYGVEPTAGPAGAGILFQLGPSRRLRVLYTFTGGVDGRQPSGRLTMNRGGAIFGTTVAGGSAGQGAVFTLPPGGRSVVTLYSFPGTPGGGDPLEGVAMNGAGDLFGTASLGDLPPGNGEVFTIRANGSMRVLHRFASHQDGHCPFSGVILGSDGDLYGLTVGMGFGGQPNGSVYELHLPSQRLETLYSFTDGDDGEFPQIMPTQDAAGHLFGVTSIRNGNPFPGAIWTMTGKKFRVLYDFSGGADGYLPNGPLTLGPDGNLYGTTQGGGSAAGSSGHGVVFRITPAGRLTVLHRFSGGRDGAGPTGTLAIDPAGNIYGATASGTIFEIRP